MIQTSLTRARWRAESKSATTSVWVYPTRCTLFAKVFYPMGARFVLTLAGRRILRAHEAGQRPPVITRARTLHLFGGRQRSRKVISRE